MGYVHNEVLVSHLFPILYPEFISVFDLMWIQQKHRFYFLIQSVSLCLSLGKMSSLVLRAINKWCLLVSDILLLWYSIFHLSLFTCLLFILCVFLGVIYLSKLNFSFQCLVQSLIGTQILIKFGFIMGYFLSLL